MGNKKEHIVNLGVSIKDALDRIDKLADGKNLFVQDEENRIVASLTDGDIRRGLISGKTLTDPVDVVMQRDFKFLIADSELCFKNLRSVRQAGIELVPSLDKERKLVKIIDLSEMSSLLPLEAIIMAGGRGKRLGSLTDERPKPLLPLQGKPIIEHNLDRLARFGINKFFVSVRYLADQIIRELGDGSSKGISIEYIIEDKPLGTAGSISLIDIKNISTKDVLITNSDLLTNIDIEDFYDTFLESGADMAVASIPYSVNVPYAVLELSSEEELKSFREKPTYTYSCSAGMYIVKKELFEYIPEDSYFDMTDFMDKLLLKNKKVVHFEIRGYWLDIGRTDDYKKAQEDIKHIKF